MLEKKSVFLQAICSFVAAIISSFIFSSLFGKLYIFKAKMIAMQVGIIKKNKYVDYEIEIKKSDE